MGSTYLWLLPFITLSLYYMVRRRRRSLHPKACVLVILCCHDGSKEVRKIIVILSSISIAMLASDLSTSRHSLLLLPTASHSHFHAGTGGLHPHAGCQLGRLHLRLGAQGRAKSSLGIWIRNIDAAESGGRSSRSLTEAALSFDRCIRATRDGSAGAQLDCAVADAEKMDNSANPTASKCVLVVGATGGVGQLVTAALLDRGIQVCALLRDIRKGQAFFGDHATDKLQMCSGDIRQLDTFDPSLFKGVTHVICCTGTTAFPSKRWIGDNTPEQTDWHGVRNLVAAIPATVKKFVLVSSVGVTRYDQLPWSIMNLFGVLKFKKMGEDFLRSYGIPYTIIRPGRLTDGPYTSYDLNTLLKATAGNRRAVILDQGDKLVGEASRIIVAEACIQALDLGCSDGQTYEINSIEGIGPGQDANKWERLFRKAHVVQDDGVNQIGDCVY